MQIFALSFLALLPPQVVVEMNDGVRELQVGKTGVRVEVRNRGNDLASPPPPAPGRRVFTEEEVKEERFCDSWD